MSQNSAKGVEDRTAMIFGISNDVADRIIYDLANKGFKVILIDSSKKKLQLLTKNIRNSGAKAYAIEENITDEENIEKIVALVEKRFKRIDILVNFTGQNSKTTFHELELEKIDEIVSRDLKIPIILSRLMIPSMKARGYGHIINVQLDNSRSSVFNEGVTTSTKTGLSEFIKSLESEYRHLGVCASLIDASCFQDSCIANSPLNIYRNNWIFSLSRGQYLANEISKTIQSNETAYLASTEI